jgi:general stress protein 26
MNIKKYEIKRGLKMDAYEKALQVMNELFAKDYQFAMATVKGNTPSVRFIDTFFENGSFYVVTYSKSQKVQEVKDNSQVSLCNKLYRFSGNACNIGHPLLSENKSIRENLIKVFEPWYFAHNNENDENMCYVKIELKEGFFYKDGTGYKVNFQLKEVEQFPFDFDIIPV